MKRLVGILGISLLLFPAASVLCQSETGESTIADEEYGIYRLVADNLAGRFSVNKETMGGVRVDADVMISANGIQPDADTIKDFNEKNDKKHRLSEAFVRVMTKNSGISGEGRQVVTFSRIGFDREKRHAMLVMGITLYYPEDVMNEGKYVFLEKQKDGWTIRNTTVAWNMRLGLIP